MRQIVVDELHLLLRRSDVLIRNIVMAAMTADMRIHKDESKQTEKLLQSIRECSITFRVRIQIIIEIYLILKTIIDLAF